VKYLHAAIQLIFGRLLLALFAVAGWMTLFTPAFRGQLDKWLIEDVLGKEKAEFLLYRHGPSFAHSEPALSFWWMTVKLELLAFATGYMAWAVAFKLFHLRGPSWLINGWFSVSGVLAVEITLYVLYMIADVLTNPDPPDMVPPGPSDDNT
jgi:hypothetical protein